MKYLAPILFLLIACNTAKHTVTVYDTVHKSWCCKYDTTIRAKDSVELRIKKKDSTVCCKFDTTKETVKIPVPVDSPYTVPVPIIKYYDSLVAKPKDTLIPIPIYVNPEILKLIKSGQVKYTIQFR